MREAKQRQGVKISTVRGKRVYDDRRRQAAGIPVIFILFLVLYVVTRKGPVVFVIYCVAWLAYVLWFAVRKLFHYNFLADDGMYIVRFGYAVRIPWEMIESAEVVVDFGRYANHHIVIHFRSWPVDEVTGTRIPIVSGRDDVFFFHQGSLAYFKQHTRVDVSTN